MAGSYSDVVTSHCDGRCEDCVSNEIDLCRCVCVWQCVRQWRLGRAAQLAAALQGQRLADVPHRTVESL